MQAVSDELAEYLNSSKHLLVCDLYTLTLFNGNVYYFTNADRDITLNGNTYLHDTCLWKRQQTKINNVLSVDSMTVSIYATPDDHIAGKSIFQAAHDGFFDRATLALSKCFRRNDNEAMYASERFSGNVEIKQCGGLQLQLTVKSKMQGLSQEFPLRKFYPAGTYSSNGSQVSASTDGNSTTCVAPFKPLKEVVMP